MIGSLNPKITALIMDMDGVLWRGNQPIGDLPSLFSKIGMLDLPFVLATNNATLSVQRYLDKFHNFGIQIEPWQVINSGQALGYTLKDQFPQGGPVYLIGEIGLQEALADFGFFPGDDDHVLAVVAGLDRGITYEKLRKATLLIRKGIPFMGTNPDLTYPSPDGLIPGAGSILAALEASTGVRPTIAGKPQPAMFKLAIKRLKTTPNQTLAIGDRLDTDIAGAQAIGCRTALVLTGVSTYEQAQSWSPPLDLIAQDIYSLLSD
jgi:4-nitrophenyl phosphatase